MQSRNHVKHSLQTSASEVCHWVIFYYTGKDGSTKRVATIAMGLKPIAMYKVAGNIKNYFSDNQ
jgi:hypothetical protein